MNKESKENSKVKQNALDISSELGMQKKNNIYTGAKEGGNNSRKGNFEIGRLVIEYCKYA